MIRFHSATACWSAFVAGLCGCALIVLAAYQQDLEAAWTAAGAVVVFMLIQAITQPPCKWGEVV